MNLKSITGVTNEIKEEYFLSAIQWAVNENTRGEFTWERDYLLPGPDDGNQLEESESEWSGGGESRWLVGGGGCCTWPTSSTRKSLVQLVLV